VVAITLVVIRQTLRLPFLPALNPVFGLIVAKIRLRPALNLVFGLIVAKIRLRPALNPIFGRIVAKSWCWPETLSKK